MAQIVRGDDECSLLAPPIRLTFRWAGDRWTHRIDAGSVPVASSVEWDPDRDDPDRVVSPAYQQLSQQDGPSGVQALLVGQWGPHHGSGVFTVSEGPSGVTIDVDVAVRSRSGLAALASTYRVHLASGDLIDADPSGILWGLAAPPRGRLRFEPGGLPARVGLAEGGRRETRAQADTPPVAGAATHRLLYRWRWIPDGAPATVLRNESNTEPS